jgi:hypothetical protein
MAVLVARVQQEPRRWEHRDSMDWNTLRDRLVLRAALDSAMVEVNFDRLAKGDSLLAPQAVGVLLRDRTIEKLAPTWHEEALEKAVSVFDTLPRPTSGMSMIDQMRIAGVKPTVSEEEGRLVLAESSAGAYTLGELVRDFGRLNPLYRPRVSTVANVKEMVANVFFENVLRKAAVDRGLERRPDIARQLAERAEYLDVSRFVAREVYAKIAMDSVTLRRYFSEHRSNFDFDERAQIVRMVFPGREEAMVKRLAIPTGRVARGAERAGGRALLDRLQPRQRHAAVRAHEARRRRRGARARFHAAGLARAAGDGARAEAPAHLRAGPRDGQGALVRDRGRADHARPARRPAQARGGGRERTRPREAAHGGRGRRNPMKSRKIASALAAAGALAALALLATALATGPAAQTAGSAGVSVQCLPDSVAANEEGNWTFSVRLANRTSLGIFGDSLLLVVEPAGAAPVTRRLILPESAKSMSAGDSVDTQVTIGASARRAGCSCASMPTRPGAPYTGAATLTAAGACRDRFLGAREGPRATWR